MASGIPLLPTDPLLRLYYHKSLAMKLMGHAMRFAAPASVFSTFQIDRGTQRLLRAVAAAKPSWETALDIGCGYGAIALYLAKAGFAKQVDAIEPDALALAFARHNARANNLPAVNIRGGVAYQDVPTAQYDAIITNLPAKAGHTVHQAMLQGASAHLRPGGVVWLVAVEPLADHIDEFLAADGIDLKARISHNGHVVYNYAFTAPIPPPAAPYLRGKQHFQWRGRRYTLDCLNGLPDFDSRGWAAEAAVELFAKVARNRKPWTIAVCNPGQGHLPVLAAGIVGNLRRISLRARDFLALQATRHNLLANRYAGEITCDHTVTLHTTETKCNMVLATLREKEGMAVTVEKVLQLFAHNPACQAILACKAAFGGKLAETLGKKGLSIQAKDRSKGATAIHVLPKPQTTGLR